MATKTIKKTVIKTTKKVEAPSNQELIRSDQNLLALGLFSVALLLGVFIFMAG